MSETGFTSLILAAAGGHLEVVKTLVEKVMMAMNPLYAMPNCTNVPRRLKVWRPTFNGRIFVFFKQNN